MKKAYTLLITIVLITSFSVLGVFIMQTKALKSENLTNQYLYIQGKNHLNFFKEYIEELDLKDINHLQLEDDLFNIYANIESKDSSYIIHIHVKAKDFDISLYEKVIKE